MPSRPVLRLRLQNPSFGPGEIPLDELARIATATQKVVRRMARGLVDQRRPGRSSAAVETATALMLVGLSSGSTVLEIAGAEPQGDALPFEVPSDLGELSLGMFLDGLSAIADDSRESPTMPVGFDKAALADMDDWLASLRDFAAFSVDSHIGGRDVQISATPSEARLRLAQVESQPAMPYISRSEQALEGSLYALNLHTGTYSIEDDAGHKIRLRVPADMRAPAALLVNRRVRAVGRPEVDDTGRLAAFSVARLIQAPDLSVLEAQGRFYDRHELVPVPPASSDSLDAWAVSGLTDNESDDFMSALAELR